MTIRIPTLDAWSPMLEPVPFRLREHEQHRKVDIKLNCHGLTAIHFHYMEQGEPNDQGEIPPPVEVAILLASVQGYEVLSFTLDRDGELVATPAEDWGETWFYTEDGMQYQLAAPLADTFAEPYIRKQRNHAQEMMALQAGMNNARMQARLEATIQRLEEKQVELDKKAKDAGTSPTKVTAPVQGADNKPADGSSDKPEGVSEKSGKKGKPGGDETGT